MRLLSVCLLVVLGVTVAPLAAAERPVIKSSQAAEYAGKTAKVQGRVIEVRRVANGPVIFELDGKPSAPTFRALVYPMSVPRFGAEPETVYLGQLVEVTGAIVIRNDLPQMWLSDPSHIRLVKIETPTETAAEPEAGAE